MKAIILCNVGTPANASPSEVKAFLRHFLSDRYVISIPQPFRYLLVNGIIIPHRLQIAVERYKLLEELCGGEMPLRRHTHNLVETMQKRHSSWHVYNYFRYGGESPEMLIEQLRSNGPYHEVVILPLFPQKTYSTYLSATVLLRNRLRKLLPEVSCRIVAPYFNHPRYLSLLQQSLGNALQERKGELFVASFHSIPWRHQRMGQKNGFDYQAQCIATAEGLFEHLPKEIERTICFQSAFNTRRWIGPHLEEIWQEWIQQGFKRVVLLSPGFAVDCLETLLDIGVQLRQQFLSHGGESFTLLPALNASESVADFLIELAEESLLD